MANTHKILGQAAPATSSSTLLYEVPSGRQAIVSTLTICNRTAGEVAFDVAVIPSGGTLDDEHYVYYNLACPGRDTFAATLGIALNDGESIEVKDYDGNSLTFVATGVEIV